MMRDDISIICAKIAGAEGGNEYTIRMQNAAIIRDYAMHLYVQVGSLRYHESFKDKDFVRLKSALGNLPNLANHIYYLPMEMYFIDQEEQFWDWLRKN